MVRFFCICFFLICKNRKTFVACFQFLKTIELNLFLLRFLFHPIRMIWIIKIDELCLNRFWFFWSDKKCLFCLLNQWNNEHMLSKIFPHKCHYHIRKHQLSYPKICPNNKKIGIPENLKHIEWIWKNFCYLFVCMCVFRWM